MSKDEAKDSFKVVDKRRFTEEGDTKASAGVPSGENEKVGVGTRDDDASNLNREEASSTLQGGPVDFPSFVISLATQAVVMMGEMPNPETGKMSINVEAARQTIDILAMLQEKTQGNLLKEEANLLQEVLTSLRLAYVNKSGAKK